MAPRHAFSVGWFMGGLVLVGCSGMQRSPLIAGIQANEDRPQAQIAVQSEIAPREGVAAPQPTEPTWTTIYARYFAPETEGGCGRSSACHAIATADAASTYEW